MRLLALLALAALGRDDGAQVYRLTLRAGQPDTFLPAPRAPNVVFKIDARYAPPKSRVMFLTPLPAGPHRLRLEVAGPVGDRTFVIAVPLASGRSSVEVTLTGAGRYDFGFWSGQADAPLKEYRFTVKGPATRTFALQLP